MIREVFATVDEIERVLFRSLGACALKTRAPRSYPNNEKAFFAQIDFKTGGSWPFCSPERER